MRVRTRRQYQRIAQQPTRHVGRWLIVDKRISKGPSVRLGITASKHFGIAVQRNRFKRIVREAFRICRVGLEQGFDINVKPRHMAHEAKSSDILHELVTLLGAKEGKDQVKG